VLNGWWTLPASNLRLTIPVTPPGTMGTTKGGHVYIEAPDQSATPTGRMDGITLMDGSSGMQTDWNPIDLGLFPYLASEQAWTTEIYTGLDPQVSHDIRVYVSSYSDEIDLPLVRHGLAGATPSVVITVGPQTSGKPNSGSNVTEFLVTGISASVASPVTVSGKLLRPIGVTVDLSGLSAHRPVNWAYTLVGFANGDITSTPYLSSGYITQDGLIPAGPDGISTPHTFAPPEPTAVTSITIYAVAGRIVGDNYMPRLNGNLPPGSFVPNNIVPGITASCVISIGSTTGVTDPTAFIQSLLDTSVGVNGAVFGVLPLGVDNTRIALLAVDTSKLAALAVTAAKLGNSSVTATAIASLAVGTSAIQTAAITTALIANGSITNALIGNLAVGTANIQNLAVGDAQIFSLSANKITAGTISASISISAPAITGGTITGAALSVTSGAGVLTSITPSSSGLVVSFGSQNTLIAQGGVIVTNGAFNSSLNVSNLEFNSTQVVCQRQPGPGTPSFSSLSDAQTWCTTLLGALRTHGLVT
jgi:hypothetical protein